VIITFTGPPECQKVRTLKCFKGGLIICSIYPGYLTAPKAELVIKHLEPLCGSVAVPQFCDVHPVKPSSAPGF